MRRYLWLLLCGALLAPPVLAAKPEAETAGPDARKQELSTELNQFVRDAIDEGLLAPSGSGAAAEPMEPSAEVETVERGVDAAPTAPSDVWALSGPMDCNAPYPLDFSEFEAIASYSDILNYRTQLMADGVSATDDPRLAKAYIALDMASEAVMNLSDPTKPNEQALYHVAQLLDGRIRPDLTYFQALAQCHEKAELWLGIALLIDGQGTGAAYIDKRFNAFRELPLQLRTSVTAIAVPALDRTDGRFLSQKMLASFGEAELRDSAQLQFANAILEMGQGNTQAEILIRTFLLQGRFQEEALFALIRHHRVIDAPVKALLLDGMLFKIEQSQRDEDIRASMKFVLDELSAESRYLTMMDMAGRDNMQSEAAQSEIRIYFVTGLQRDLASDDPLHNLAAIEALSIEAGLLDHHEQRKALYEAATLKAVRLGFASLADELSRKTQPGEAVAEQRATLAYRLKDYPAVFQLADANPSNIQIGLVAALSAIDANDAAQLQLFTSRLKLDDATILALIEQDAASQRWIVPNAVYQAAGAITDEASKARADRVLGLKQAAASGVAEPSPTSIAGVPDRLMTTRMALDSLEGGSN
ncbi:hypothetical protein HNE_0254 [Hyphomonas neptunium ATCC 15444]|uniref:Chemotaxis protein n=2 Tax=Hyphomonas TaxID=85 RepID=Q0C5K8_HYPNA|nr:MULTISPECIES: hypothetical protein [Hyphomonas]ABI76459.1 hypothetical protein HNE_0254 [Hyphomonas neptunium ATCC 15444]KCZ95413.1 hypothetical protein HHI_04635 [Hyphomonas hirschiana VP5]